MSSGSGVEVKDSDPSEGMVEMIPVDERIFPVRTSLNCVTPSPLIVCPCNVLQEADLVWERKCQSLMEQQGMIRFQGMLRGA